MTPRRGHQTRMPFDFNAQSLSSLARRIEKAVAPILKGASTPSPTIDLERFRKELGKFAFEAPRPIEEIEDWVISTLAEGAVQTLNPRYFGLFNPNPFSAARRADLIASAFNHQLCVWSHAPAAVEIERHVIRAVGARAGFTALVDGHFTSGGAEANATSLQCALVTLQPAVACEGVARIANPRLYVSTESHTAWFKIAHQAGLGRQSVQLVPTDGDGRMDCVALEAILAEDRLRGATPIMIAATAGTTNGGMVDPLHQLAQIAEAQKIWFHVDAAWGGALIASRRLAPVLDGMHRADSVTIDAHKWFGATMGAGMFLTTRSASLAEAFKVDATYMPSCDSSRDLYLSSYQWSRRAVGLRLFMILAEQGWEGIAAHVEKAVMHCDQLAASLVERGWTRRNESRMAVACMIPPGGSIGCAAIVERVVSSGEAWISLARFEGEPVIRFCATNGLSGHDDFIRLGSALISAASS